MPIHIPRVRHDLTKSPLIRLALAWLYHRGLDQNDIFVASYPRAGSTWLRFLLYELLTRKASSFEAVNESIPDIGHHRGAPELVAGSARLIKTHEPFRREYGRAVYLVRDVRDVVISEYYFQQLWQLFDGTFQEFLDSFLEGRVNRYGSWGRHTDRWLDARESAPDRIFLVRFDELKRDTHGTLASVLAFLGAAAGDEQIEQAITNNKAARMREKESSLKLAAGDLRFVRKGEVGAWQDFLTAEQVRQIEMQTAPTLRRLGYWHEPADPVTAADDASLS
jgi:hypothetical protein